MTTHCPADAFRPSNTASPLLSGTIGVKSSENELFYTNLVDRQDGYTQRPTTTYAPRSSKRPAVASGPQDAAGTSLTAVDSSELSFSAFMSSMSGPSPTWLHPVDSHLVVPLFAADASMSALAADALKPLVGMATRAVEKASFDSVQPKSQPRTPRTPATDDLRPSVSPSGLDTRYAHADTTVAAVEIKKESTTPSPLSGAAVGDALDGQRRPSKERKRPLSFDGLQPDTKRRAVRQSRERSASRSRQLVPARIDNGLVDEHHTGFQSSDEEEASFDAFSRLLRHRRPFKARMGRERNHLQDLLADLRYAIRQEQYAEEAERIAAEELEAETQLTATPTDGEGDKEQRRSRRSRTVKPHDDMSAMRPDSSYIRDDLDLVRKLIAAEQAHAVATAAVDELSAPSPPAGGQGSNPPSPVFSLCSVSPPSSRSVSPLPETVRSRSLSPSPSSSIVRDELELPISSSKPAPVIASTKRSAPAEPAVYQSPALLASLQHSKQLVQAISQEAAQSKHADDTYVVEAIIGHRRPGRGAKSRGTWESDWRDWRNGVRFEYCVRWIGFRQPTWEPQKGLGAYLVREYWAGRGPALWTDDEIRNLYKKMQTAEHSAQSQHVH